MWKPWQYWKGNYNMARIKKININNEIYNIEGLTIDKGYPELTKSNVEKVHYYIVNKSSYASHRTDNHVQKYFQEHAGDTSLSAIVTKVILVDTADSTNLQRLLGRNAYEIVAKQIIDCDIENLIKEGKSINDVLFKRLAWTRKNKIQYKNLFIFMSKYITRTSTYSYNGNYYSIMDNVVKKNLGLYNDVAKGLVIPNLENIRKNYQYSKYCELLGSIASKLEVTREMLDHFVWFVFKNATA